MGKGVTAGALGRDVWEVEDSWSVGNTMAAGRVVIGRTRWEEEGWRKLEAVRPKRGGEANLACLGERRSSVISSLAFLFLQKLLISSALEPSLVLFSVVLCRRGISLMSALFTASMSNLDQSLQ